MTAGGADALDHALGLRGRPDTVAQLRRLPLPDSVLLLIRIAAGDRQAVQLAAARTSADAPTLTVASVDYLRQVLFAADADNYRLLGVREDAGDDALKEHYRWLMRWLHPDRDPDRGGESDAQRVNRAWYVLRSDERRRAYDRQRERRAARAERHASMRSSHRHVSPRRPPPRLRLSPRAMRFLPTLVLGGMALLACGSLAAWRWLEQADDASALAAQRAHRDESAHAPVQPALAKAAIAPSSVVAAAPAVAASATRIETKPQLRPTPPSAMERAPAQDAATSKRSEAKASEPSAATTTDRQDADSPYAAVADELASAYAQGDLDQVMGLFDPDAFDDPREMARVADEYRRLFRQTGSRRLHLGELTWNAEDRRVVGTGLFDARIRRHGHLYARHLRGRIVLELVPVENQWKIHRLALERDPR